MNQTDDKLNAEEAAIILRAEQLIYQLLDSEPEPWQTWDYGPWSEQIQHGPRYAVGHWFGAQDEKHRMRFRRAIDTLESRGLVKTHRWNTRLTHVDLTSEGFVVADRLRQEAAAGDE